jgi:hypothetical protein
VASAQAAGIGFGFYYTAVRRGFLAIVTSRVVDSCGRGDLCQSGSASTIRLSGRGSIAMTGFRVSGCVLTGRDAIVGFSAICLFSACSDAIVLRLPFPLGQVDNFYLNGTFCAQCMRPWGGRRVPLASVCAP